MDDGDFLERIQRILERHETVPQGVKDELILLGLSQILTQIRDHSARLAFLEKYKPYLQALAWITAVIAGTLIAMAFSGKIIVFPP